MSEVNLGNLKSMVQPNHYLKTEYSTYWTQWLLANSVLRDGIWYINETPPSARTYNETRLGSTYNADYLLRSGSYYMYYFVFGLSPQNQGIERPYTVSSPYESYNLEMRQNIVEVSLGIKSSSDVITLTIPEYREGNDYWTGLTITFRVTSVGSDGITIISEEQI